LLAVVISDQSAHSLLIGSPELAERGLELLMRPWRSTAGTVLLVAAFLTHYANALWSIYIRRSLRMMRWEWGQLALGLCIPLLLSIHVASTRLAEALQGADTSYTYLLTLHWVIAPQFAALQVAMLSTIWIHACIGLHFWLRTKRW